LLEAFKAGGQSAEEVSQHILWELRKFVGLAKRTDDVTMIVVRLE
jgi:serine phosphatase RsbU (regulator of sigma subunit)